MGRNCLYSRVLEYSRRHNFDTTISNQIDNPICRTTCFSPQHNSRQSTIVYIEFENYRLGVVCIYEVFLNGSSSRTHVTYTLSLRLSCVTWPTCFQCQFLSWYRLKTGSIKAAYRSCNTQIHVATTRLS